MKREKTNKWNLISAFWRQNDRTPNINFISSYVRFGDHSNFHLLVLSTSEMLSNERMPEQHFGIPCRRLFVLVTFARHSFRRLFVLASFSTPAKTPKSTLLRRYPASIVILFNYNLISNIFVECLNLLIHYTRVPVE